MPKVSFIVAVYNSMPYLKECLDSLINQTVLDIEIICVNDCSPDNSLIVINEYIKKDNRIKLINHETNIRQGGAWNSGVSIASGEYLCFVDADDWLELDYCEILKECQSDIIVAKSFFEGYKITTNIDEVEYKRCGNDIIRYILLNRGNFITNFYRRSLFVRSNFKFIENNTYHDFMTTLLYFYTNDVTLTAMCGYHYRVDNISLQRSMNQITFWGRLEVAKLQYETLLSLDKQNIYREELEYNFFRLFNCNSLIRAFYGFTKLDWTIINQIKYETNIIVPNIHRNKYYRKINKNYSFIMRIPLYLFSYFPKKVVDFLHHIYLTVRKMVNNNYLLKLIMFKLFI